MHGLLPIPNAIDWHYWESSRKEVFSLQQCQECRHILFPPGARCPKCNAKTLEWITLTGRGVIWSWVVFHRKYFPDMPPPYTVVRVQLAEGPFIITNLVDTGDREPSIGASVKVCFRQVGQLVLPQFTLA